MLKISLLLLAFFSSNSLYATSAYDAMAKIRNCSASVIQFEGQKENDKVLLLTNGHCVNHQLLAADTMINRPYTDIANIYRGNTPLIVGSLTIDNIIYATMTNTDIAILRTTLTYQEFKEKLHLEPLKIADTQLSKGQSVSVASGYLERYYQCQVEDIVNSVKEDKWQWHPVTRLVKSDTCLITHGASGSPVIGTAGKIVALINTGSQSGQPCSLHNPCEVDINGKMMVKKEAIYAVDTRMLNSCFPNGELSFTPKCTLVKPQISIIHTLPLYDPEHHEP